MRHSQGTKLILIGVSLHNYLRRKPILSITSRASELLFFSRFLIALAIHLRCRFA